MFDMATKAYNQRTPPACAPRSAQHTSVNLPSASSCSDLNHAAEHGSFSKNGLDVVASSTQAMFDTPSAPVPFNPTNVQATDPTSGLRIQITEQPEWKSGTSPMGQGTCEDNHKL